MLYDVYRSTTPFVTTDSVNLVASGLTTLAFRDGPLAAGTYYYRIVARDDAGNSAPSYVVSISVGMDTTAPSVPSGLTATATSPTSATLYWADSTDAFGVAGYNVFRDGVKIASAADNGYTDATLAASTAYSYTVSAYDLAGNTSALSNVASVTTPAAITEPPVTTGVLPFDMPARSTLVKPDTIDKQVRYHLFLPYPTSVDDKNGATDSSEYWRREWFPPGGVEGTVNHGVYGGLVRARKYTRAPRGSGYQIKDYEDEVRMMVESGVDGVWVDLLQVPQSSTDNPQRWQQLKYFRQAVKNVAAADGVNLDGFVGIMPDGSTSGTKSATTLVNAFKVLAADRTTWRPGGRLIVATYQPEVAPAYANKDSAGAQSCLDFWVEVTRQARAAGLNPLMWWCFSRTWTTYAPKFVPLTSGGTRITNGLSRWGDRDPVASISTSNANATAAQYSNSQFAQPWMHPVSQGDDRPRGGAFWERRNTEQLRHSWLAAMGLTKSLVKTYRESNMVQLPTWDDFAEGSEFYPTKYNGSVYRDVNAFYLVRYKTGAWPKIVRDCIYLTHRVHPMSGTTFTSSQTKFATVRGSTSVVNDVEALIFTTSPVGAVTITTGGVTSTFDMAAATAVAPGVYSFRAPLRSGAVKATYVRNGTTVAAVTSPYSVSTTQLVQDTSYRGVSSLRAA